MLTRQLGYWTGTLVEGAAQLRALPWRDLLAALLLAVSSGLIYALLLLLEP